MEKTTKRLSKVYKGLDKDMKLLLFVYSDRGLELCKMDKSTVLKRIKFKVLFNFTILYF